MNNGKTMDETASFIEWFAREYPAGSVSKELRIQLRRAAWSAWCARSDHSSQQMQG